MTQKAQAILIAHCGKCHGTEATAGFNINDRTAMIAKGQIKPGDATHSRAYIRAFLTPDDPMPPRSQKDALTPDEQATLKKWIEAGAKVAAKASSGSRKFISTEAIYEAIKTDLARADERDRQYLRYFTLAHLYNAGASDDDLHAYSLALSKLLNSLSWQKRIAVPQPVDAAHTILRIDMRHYSWTTDTWRKLLLVYPYAVVAQSASAKSVCADTGCDLPCVRADWFVARAGQPLLYHDLLALPRTVHELEAKLLVDVDKNIREETAMRAGFGESGVSRNNRIVERHESAYGAYWRSYDFSSSAGKQNIFQNPLSFEAAGGEIIFNLPNGLQGYMLINGKGERISVGPVEIVSNKENTNDPVVRNGLTCMTCHTRGLKRFNDQVRAVIEKTPAPDYDRNKALALYGQPPRLAVLMEEDGKRFAAGVHETGIEVSDTEPIVALAAKYDAPLNLTQAASEIGLTAEILQTRLRENAPLGSLLAVLQTPGGQIKRDAWEQAQEDIAGRLALGVYLAPRISVGKNGEGQFTSIAEAVRAARPGARIFVRPGIYNEVVVIDKAIELIGDGNVNEIRIESASAPCITTQAEGVALRGMTLRDKGQTGDKPCDVVFASSGRLLVENCDIAADGGSGVVVSGGKTSAIVRKCSIHDCRGVAVVPIQSGQVQVEDCDIYGCIYSNMAVGSKGILIVKRCKVHDGRQDGIYVAEAGRATVEGCDLYRNGMAGISVSLSSDAQIRQCQVHSNATEGIRSGLNSTCHVEDCPIYGNGASGISITDNSQATYQRCQSHHNNHDGAWVGNNGSGTFEDCTIYSNGGAGIGVHKSHAEVTGCHINDNQLAGVWAQDQSVVAVWRCTLASNKEGAYKLFPGTKFTGGANQK